jgi:hypothetical protein
MLRIALVVAAVAAFPFTAAALFCTTTSSFAAEAFTSDIPPFSIEQGPRVGFVREIVVESD